MNPEVRTAPPSREPNNADVFVWALATLGGESINVDIEAIYLKAFEIAPLRLGWRTRPDLPNFKKVAKALQEAEARSHVGLLLKVDPNTRRLSPAGVEWVSRHRAFLERTYGAAATPLQPAKNSEFSRQRRQLQQSDAWSLWLSGREVSRALLAVALECSPFSAPSVWEDRFADLHAIARATSDDELKRFADDARKIYESQV